MTWHRAIPVLSFWLMTLLSAPGCWASVAEPPGLEAGFRQMYNLDFAAAHNTFESWESAHPADPLGPASNAAAYLFSEFNRLHILESELFTDDRRFQKRSRPVPDPEVRSAFEKELGRTDRLAQSALAENPRNADAIFALVMANGLRGDYAALIEKRDVAGLGYLKTGRQLAERLLADDPNYYDAYLAVGAENYLLSLSSAPVRWLLRMGGAQTSREVGLTKLRMTAEKGHYLAPYARLLLAVAALRDHDRVTAARLLSGLSEEFPQNPLYRRELARLQPQSAE